MVPEELLGYKCGPGEEGEVQFGDRTLKQIFLELHLL